jgi:hypothetical protein
MMRVPSMDEIWEVAESRGANSEAPHLWEGLVAAFPLCEGAGNRVFNVVDRSRHLRFYDTTEASWALAPWGRAKYQTESGQHFGQNNMIRIRPNVSVTFSQWIIPQVWNGNNPGFWRAQSLYTFNIFRSNTGFPWIGWNGVDVLSPNTGYQVPLNQVAHCVYVMRMGDSGTGFMGFYTQGILRHSATGTYSNPGFSIGHLGYQFTTSQFIGGYHGPLMFHERALSAQEIAELYADPWAMYRVCPRVLVRGVTLPAKKIPIHHLMAGCT